MGCIIFNKRKTILSVVAFVLIFNFGISFLKFRNNNKKNGVNQICLSSRFY